MCGRMKYVPKIHMGHEPQIADLRRGSAEVEAIVLNQQDSNGEPLHVRATWQGHARRETLNVVWRGWSKALIPATAFWEGKRRIDLPENSFIAAIVRKGINDRWFLAVVTRDPYNEREEALVANKLRRRLPLVVRKTENGWEHVAVM